MTKAQTHEHMSQKYTRPLHSCDYLPVDKGRMQG